jgi:DNA-binding NarL/FixJ family response regulator
MNEDACRQDLVRALRLAADAVETLGAGLLVIDSRGAPAVWSDSAARLLRQVFGAGPEDGLPAPVRRWLGTSHLRSVNFAGGGTELVLTRVEGEAGVAVIAREQRRTSAESLARLGLTPRRAEVLAALMDGETNQQIAHRLALSPRTVQNHVAHIFEVLGARTRTEAAALARRVLETG